MFPIDKPDVRRGPLAGRPARRFAGRRRYSRAVPAAVRSNAGNHRRRRAGEDEARRTAGERRPGAAGGHRRLDRGAAVDDWLTIANTRKHHSWRSYFFTTSSRRASRGAVLDVTDPEPLPPESPLWELPNVIITPHVGGQSAWRIDRMTELFCQNLRRWRAGLPLVNFISDKRLGFPIRGGGYPLWGEPCEPEMMPWPRASEAGGNHQTMCRSFAEAVRDPSPSTACKQAVAHPDKKPGPTARPSPSPP